MAQRKRDPNRPGHGVRWQPQTAQVGRCVVCRQLYTPAPDDDGSLCWSCREQPGLFPTSEVKV